MRQVQRRVGGALLAIVMALGLASVVTVATAAPAAAAGCAYDYVDTSDYGYTDYWTGDPVWRDTRWIPARSTGCRDVNVRNPYDRWSNRYSCATVRIWWNNENSARNWVWVCGSYTVLSAKKIGQSYIIETWGHPYSMNVLD